MIWHALSLQVHDLVRDFRNTSPHPARSSIQPGTALNNAIAAARKKQYDWLVLVRRDRENINDTSVMHQARAGPD